MKVSNTGHPCAYSADHARVIDLLLDYRAATGVCLYPTVWRLRLLWSSRVWEPAQDARIWEDDDGRVSGFALLWRRRPDSPYLALERIVHPTQATAELVTMMLAWAVQRAQAIAAGQSAPLTLFANQLPSAAQRDPSLETYGFTAIAPNPEEHNVYLSHPMQAPLPEPALPPGYVLRPLAGESELEAYAAISGFAAVSAEHQRELLASDEYEHLVVVGPDGAFAAYCECSICRDEWARSGQRVGWIDYVETRPEQQRRGLGRAALLAGLRQVREWGAETAALITVNTNTPALKLYETVGFARMEISEVPGYEKQVTRNSSFDEIKGD